MEKVTQVTFIIFYFNLIMFSSRLFAADKAVTNLYDQGMTYFNKADYKKAAQLFEKGLSAALEQMDSKSVCAFAGNLGMVCTNFGDYRKAILYYQDALRTARYSGDDKSEAMILTNMGNIFDLTGNFDKAVDSYKLALEIFKKIKDQKGIRANVANLGAIFEKAGNSEVAIVYYKESLKIAGEINDKKYAADMLVNIGLSYANAANYSKALLNYQDALNAYEALQLKSGVSDVYLKIGNVMMNLGDYDSSLEFFNKSLVLKSEAGEKKGIADAVYGIGTVYEMQGYPEEAVIQYMKSMKIKNELGIATEKLEAKIADSCLVMGKYDDAEKIYARLGDPVGLGRLEISRNNYPEAIANFNKAVTQNAGIHDSGYLFALNCGKGLAYLGTAAVYSAQECFEKAIEYSEEQRETLNEQDRSRFFDDKTNGFYRSMPYEKMIELFFQLGSFDKAFNCSENLKARILSESLAAKHSELRQNLPDEFKNKESRTELEIRAIRRVIEKVNFIKETNVYRELEDQLQYALDRKKTLILSLRKYYPDYSSLMYPQPINLSEIKLMENEVLIEFEVCENKTYVFVVRKGNIDAKEINIGRDKLNKLVIDYRESFENVSNYDNLAVYKPELSNLLYTTLLEEAVKNIPQDTSIIIVPDEILGILPFESLIFNNGNAKVGEPKFCSFELGEGKCGPFPLGAKYIEDKYEIRYVQSAKNFALSRSVIKTRKRKDTGFVVCDPVFSKNDSRYIPPFRPEQNTTGDSLFNRKTIAIKKWQSLGNKEEKNRAAGEIKDEDEMFPRLEKISEIAEDTEKIFSKNKTFVLSGVSANESQVKETDYSKYDYLIFATHGILNSSIPWIKEPAIVLSQVNNYLDNDGYLSASEIMSMKIPAIIAILNTSSTGTGKNIQGEGVMKLGTAFQFAGCDNVIVSLWQVKEDVSVMFTGEVLKNLRRGLDAQGALKLAKGKLRQEGYEHPYYWAGFVLY